MSEKILRRKGRGAVSNATGRFEKHVSVPLSSVDDQAGHDLVPGEDEPLAAISTRITPDATRTIITRNDSPDIPFDRSINPYRGCEHGCVYCFARPTHTYLGLSAGLDFETEIISKPNAPEILERELSKPGYRPAVLALGSNTDPYQPAEKKLEITRGILQVLERFGHPVSIVTKSDLVLRDRDILESMAGQGLASVMVSLTTLDRVLARRLEPRAPAPHRRLEIIRALTGAGVPVGVLASPMIPGLNDREIESILEAAAAAGAQSAGTILLRLPYEVKTLFTEWLETHYPLRANHILSLVRQSRGGALNDASFGSRMRGKGEYAEMIYKRFALARRRYRLDAEPSPLDTGRFRVPPRSGDQRELFPD